MDKIIVFGATGNIGAYIVDYLRENLDEKQHEVVAVGRRTTSFFDTVDVKYVRCDITREADFDRLPRDGVYAIINVAGLLPAYMKEYDPYAYVETNIKGGLRILEYARKTNADRIIYTQTWAEQGGYWGETEVLSPNLNRKLIYTGDHALYAITKSTVCEMMEYYKQEYGIKNFVFRLPNVYMYNPNKLYFVDGKQKLIGYRYMIDRASLGEPIELWGNPDAFKDVLYVKDLCQMIFKALFYDRDGGLYNAGTGVKTSLREQIEGIIDVFSPLDKKSRIVEKPEGPGFTSFVMDIKNIKEDLGYVPQYTYRKYLEDYKKERELKRFDMLWKQ